MKYITSYKTFEMIDAPVGYKHNPKLASITKQEIKDILVNFSDFCDIEIDEKHNTKWRDYTISGYEFGFDINISSGIRYGEDLGNYTQIKLNNDLLDDLVRLYSIFKEDKWSCDIWLTTLHSTDERNNELKTYKQRIYNVPTSGYSISEDGIYYQYKKIDLDKNPDILKSIINIELVIRS